MPEARPKVSGRTVYMVCLLPFVFPCACSWFFFQSASPDCWVGLVCFVPFRFPYTMFWGGSLLATASLSFGFLAWHVEMGELRLVPVGSLLLRVILSSVPCWFALFLVCWVWTSCCRFVFGSLCPGLLLWILIFLGASFLVVPGASLLTWHGALHLPCFSFTLSVVDHSCMGLSQFFYFHSTFSLCHVNALLPVLTLRCFSSRRATCFALLWVWTYVLDFGSCGLVSFLFSSRSCISVTVGVGKCVCSCVCIYACIYFCPLPLWVLSAVFVSLWGCVALHLLVLVMFFFHDWLAFLCLRPSLVCSIAALAGSVGFFVGMHVFSTCGAVFVCGVCVVLCRSVYVPVSLY